MIRVLRCPCVRWLRIGPLVLAASMLVVPVVAESAGVTDTLARVGAYLESYYGRAQSVIVQEQVLIQPLRSDLSGEGFPRRVVNELRIEWDPSSEDRKVNIVRR